MHVLITGNGGYLGAIMAPMLRDQGHRITGLDTYFYEPAQLSSVDEQYDVIRKDLRDLNAIDLDGVDAVIHLAALSNDPLGDLRPSLTYDINLTGTIRLAEIAREAGVSRFIYSSSCSVYGAAGTAAVSETAPLNPVTPYARTKIEAEAALRLLSTPNFSPVFMRNATAYGASPRLRLDLLVNNLTAWAITTGRVRILSDGSPLRPIVHAVDIARAFAVVLDAPKDLVHNEAFNIGNDEQNYSVREIADLVGAEVGAEVVYASGGESDKRSYRVSFRKFHERFPGSDAIWDVRSATAELAAQYRAFGLREDDLTGPTFIRLARLRELIDGGQLDDSLRWRGYAS